MKKLAFLLLVVLAFTGCKKEIITVNGIIHGYVKDLNTGEYLSGALISITIGNNADTTTTGSDGYFMISGLPEGEYDVIISKTGYASLDQIVSIYGFDQVTVQRKGGSVDRYVKIDAELPELNANLTGVIKKSTYSTGIIRPLANTTLTALVYYNYYDRTYMPRYYTTTTNDRGEYTFSDLPAGLTAYIYIGTQNLEEADNY
jgi:hypothetical protein